MSGPRSPSQAELRLAQSRERIRQRLTPAPQPHCAGHRVGDSLSAWLNDFRDHPLLSSAFIAVQGWWESHPWRPAVHLANNMVREALLPVAKKHPLALVLVAATIGGAFVWFRPGRGMVKSLLTKVTISESLMGLVKQPVLGLLANQVITWFHQAPKSSPESPTPEA